MKLIKISEEAEELLKQQPGNTWNERVMNAIQNSSGIEQPTQNATLQTTELNNPELNDRMLELIEVSRLGDIQAVCNAVKPELLKTALPTMITQLPTVLKNNPVVFSDLTEQVMDKVEPMLEGKLSSMSSNFQEQINSIRASLQRGV